MIKRPPFQIKICGITRAADLVAAVRAGADAIGLNFFPDSPRYISADRAAALLQSARNFLLLEGLNWPMIVGVFVNSGSDDILRTVDACDLDAVQFHGDEPPEIVPKIKAHCNLNCGASTKIDAQPKFLFAIRALRLPPQTPASQEPAASASFQVSQEIQTWIDVGTDAILLDAAVEGAYGGSGKTLDWEAIRQLILKQNLVDHLILAGGLTPGNIAQAIRSTGVQAVDVASGVELAPGIKSEPLLKTFVKGTGWRDN